MGDIIELKRGYDLPQQRRAPGRVPVISSSGVSDYHSEVMVHGPGVVTGRYGTIGKVFYIEQDFWPLNTALYVCDFKGNDPRFISYLLRTLDFLAYSDKAAVPGVNRNHLHEALVSIPSDVSEQRAIAHVLGTLDDKIELNKRINETLESMAQVLFKSWFIDFTPIHPKDRHAAISADIGAVSRDGLQVTEMGEIPTGWIVRSVYDCAKFINGIAFSKVHFSPDGSGLPIVKIAELKDGVSAQTKFTNDQLPEKYRIRDGDLLFSWSGSPDTSIDTFVWSEGDAWLNQHIFKLQFNSVSERLFVYYLLKHLRPTFIEIARDKQTTGLGHVTAEDLKRLKVAFPPISVLEAFEKLVEPLFTRSFYTMTESRTLAALRDALLPKLLCGEIRPTQTAPLCEEVSHA